MIVKAIIKPMKEKIRLDAISVILVRPRFHENVGAVARAMKNMGLGRLVVVNGCNPLHPNAYKMASGAEEILERAEEEYTLREAISKLNCVVGMTSRKGKERSPLLTPNELAQRLIPISTQNSIGLVFGSEREGLTNEELSLCHLFVKIPSSSSFPSLNLAQSVMVICYELFQTSVSHQKNSPPLAKAEDLENMFDHMERTLTDIGFLDPRNPKRIMRSLRKIFGRSQMDEREVRILQGIWSKVDWIIKKRRGDS